MSPSLEGLVRNIIRDYFNLNIAEQLNRYIIYITLQYDTIAKISHISMYCHFLI